MKSAIYFAHHALGDLVMKFPAIKLLEEQFGAENVFLTIQKPFLLDLVLSQFDIPEKNILIYDGSQKKLRDRLGFINEWRKLEADLLIVPPTINRKLSKRLFALSRASQLLEPFNFLDAADHHEFQYPSKFKHKVLRNAEYIRYFKPEWSDDQFVSEVDDRYTLKDEVLQPPKVTLPEKYVIIHPGSGAAQKHKRIPLEKAEEIGRWILEYHKDVTIILTGTGAESDICQALQEGLKHERVQNLANELGLREFLYVIKNAKLFISGDCGPSHLASIVGTPIVTFFGPTDETITGPYKNAFVYKHVPQLRCMPCHDYKKRAANFGCPPVTCLNEMSYEPAISKVESILRHKETLT